MEDESKLTAQGDQTTFIKAVNLKDEQKQLVSQKLEHLQELYAVKSKLAKINKELLDANMVVLCW